MLKIWAEAAMPPFHNTDGGLSDNSAKFEVLRLQYLTAWKHPLDNNKYSYHEPPKTLLIQESKGLIPQTG